MLRKEKRTPANTSDDRPKSAYSYNMYFYPHICIYTFFICQASFSYTFTDHSFFYIISVQCSTQKVYFSLTSYIFLHFSSCLMLFFSFFFYLCIRLFGSSSIWLPMVVVCECPFVEVTSYIALSFFHVIIISLYLQQNNKIKYKLLISLKVLANRKTLSSAYMDVVVLFRWRKRRKNFQV